MTEKIDDIPDAPDWVAHAVDELKDIADYFDRQGKKDNGDFLRRTSNMLEVLAGAYETAKRRHTIEKHPGLFEEEQ